MVSTGSTFHSLTRAIVGQQLAVSAAATIYKRFRAACRVRAAFLLHAGCRPSASFAPYNDIRMPWECSRSL